MPRVTRKHVHTLANAYNLGSKSYGSGHMRHTTLFKTHTSTTSFVNHHKINSILRRISPVPTRVRAPERPQVARHRDGDIVGGDAKEISSENRGRMMLEKLGWRTGMGLGVEGEGMTVPIVAVMKASKRGLQ
jgi:G-patch domain/R3H domain